MEKEERLITTEAVTWHTGFESWIQFEPSGYDSRLHTTNQGSEAWAFFCECGGPVYLQRPCGPRLDLCLPLLCTPQCIKEHLSLLFLLLVSCFKVWVKTLFGCFQANPLTSEMLIYRYWCLFSMCSPHRPAMWFTVSNATVCLLPHISTLCFMVCQGTKLVLPGFFFFTTVFWEVSQILFSLQMQKLFLKNLLKSCCI